MELYLDSANFDEIEEASKLGFLTGLTTTPTLLLKRGISDVDEVIKKLSTMVNILQIEALGNTANEICKEVERLLNLGLKKENTVFKIPISLESVKACKRLVQEGIKVTIHLVYTLQQAYMAMLANATYICPLVGRLQDQGHDALSLIQQCVNAVNYYRYPSKIMFSSVRHPEHVRNAIILGVHAITVPYNVLIRLTENVFTKIGTDQFFADARLLTLKVKDVIRKENPTVTLDDNVLTATIRMTESGLGAVSIVDRNGNLVGIFTDGDLRRSLKTYGEIILSKKMSDFKFNYPITIEADEILDEAVKIFRQRQIDNIVVVENGRLCGMLDIQDLIKLKVVT